MDFSDFSGPATAVAAFFGQERANRQNRDIHWKDQAHDDMMSNTKWQRSVADMKAAGINPMLAVSQGPGSSGMSSVGAPMQDSIGKGVSSGLQALTTKTSLANVDADTKLKIANADNIRAQIPGTTASSAFEGSKYNFYNDVIKIVKHITGYHSADDVISDDKHHPKHVSKPKFIFHDEPYKE